MGIAVAIAFRLSHNHARVTTFDRAHPVFFFLLTGMKITQPPGRCVECYARELEPSQLHLTTTARFNPDPDVEQRDLSGQVRSRDVTPRSSTGSERADAIVRWCVGTLFPRGKINASSWLTRSRVLAIPSPPMERKTSFLSSE